MPENLEPDYVGVDIAAAQLDYCLSESEEGTCANDAAGRAQLISRLKERPRVRVIVEATGGYEKIVVAEMLAAGLEVCVVHPARVRAFAYAEGLLAKTDRLDARLLRRFGQKVQLRLAQPTNAAVATLRELLEHRRQLTTEASEVDGRLLLAGPTLAKLLQRQRTFLREQIARVEQMIKQHIGDDPDLRNKSERLQQITGVGPVLSATLLAYVPEIGTIGSAELSSLVGVAPHPKDSALQKHPRHVRGGRAQLRHVLYMAAVSAARSNPILAAFYQRLKANGKPAKVCLVAVMRKLLCLMHRLIQDQNFVLAN